MQAEDNAHLAQQQKTTEKKNLTSKKGNLYLKIIFQIKYIKQHSPQNYIIRHIYQCFFK